MEERAKARSFDMQPSVGRGLHLDTTFVGPPAPTMPVTVTSAGTDPLQLGAITASGDFSQTNDCPASLAPAATCTIQVKFSPTVGGARTGTLSIHSDASLPLQQLALSGIGVDPRI